MRRTIALLIAAFIWLACRKETPAAQNVQAPQQRELAQERPKSKCAAAIHAGASSEVRIFVLGIGFPEQNGDFDGEDVETTCSAFTTFERDSLTSGKASLVTEKKKLPSATTLRGFSTMANVPCPFLYDDETLEDVVKELPTGFSPTHYAVVVGPNAGTFPSDGCTDGTVMFLPSGADIGTLAHEMGHAIAGLNDEYGGNEDYRGEAFTNRNCSTDKTAFTGTTGTDGMEPCARFNSGIFHPENDCRMLHASRGPFCRVCASFVAKAFEAPALLKRKKEKQEHLPAEVGDAWEKALATSKGLDVIATLRGKTLRVARAMNADPDTLLPQVITGDWFVVAYNKSSEILAVAPLPLEGGGELFPPGRSYPSDPSKPEVPYQPVARLVHFTLLGIDEKSIAGQGLKLRLVRVPNARRDLVVTNALVKTLSTPPFMTFRYELQKPLEMYLSLH